MQLSLLASVAPTAQALKEVSAACGSLADRPDLAVVFFSTHHADAASQIARQLHEQFQPKALLGCIGEAIVGTNREIEHAPALSLWLGHWTSPAEFRPFHLAPEQTPDGLSLLGWPDDLVEGDPAGTTLLVLGDPFTFPAAEIFLPQLDSECRGIRVFGGMASGMSGPGETPLILGPDVHTQGAVGVLILIAPGVARVPLRAYRHQML